MSPSASDAPDRRSLALVCAPRAATHAVRVHRQALDADKALADFAAQLGCDLDALLVAAWTIVVGRLTGEEHSNVAATTARGPATIAIKLNSERPLASVIREVHESLTRSSLEPTSDADGHWRLGRDAAPAESLIEWRRDGDALLASSNQLDAATLATLSTALQRALAQLPKATRVADVQLLSDEERTQLLEHWNATALPRRADDCVHALFADQARATPDRIAVRAGDLALSYSALEQRANAWAAQLSERGVTSDDIVAVMLPRSADAIVALLAVLKAGATYLPLDEAYPPERLRFMLRDSGARVLLSNQKRTATFAPDGVEVVWVDAVSNEHAPAPLPPRTARDLAYIMYTSGSTGQPKGVEIPHAAIIRLVRGSKFAALDTHTVFLHAAPLGFDASTLEIWGPLLNGGCCVVHDEVIPTGAGLAATIARHGVTSAWLTAALFNTIVDENPAHLRGLRELLIGGEALSVDHVRRAYRALESTQIINGYGPTETTTFAATHPISRDLPPDATSIPIGHPIADTSLYVLNRQLQPAPVGIVGELFIGGAGLARGYRNRPELTAERFIANPFKADQRLYRTGDLVRQRCDGAIEFVGRADSQVKIRGYRIEVGEIEAQIRACAGVRNCAVIVREDRPGDKRLAAYVVGDFKLEALRNHLATRLPEFMQPSAFVTLDSLPVTANGKLDRRALPAPSNARPELAQEFRAPADADEAAVCDVFGAVLGVEGVGALDNFFALGGNSLLALRAIAALREKFGRPLSTTAFFQHPTPRGLTGELSGHSSAVRKSAGVRASIDSADEPIAIVGMAGRFPGASSVEEFWRNLCQGKESIRYFSDAELDAAVPQALRANPNYVKARGVLDDADTFDAAFFGVSPKEAELMDPQQRKFLEVCWECLEHAGYAPDACPTPVGVFAGMYNASYFQKHVVHRPDLIEKVGEFQVMLANEKDYIATRVAHRLNLTGPAVSVHTACSTSLVAVCQAFDALRTGKCGMALAGGASITCPPHSGYLYQEGAMLSPDGHTRSFDANAQGTVFSDGVAVLLLKRLSDAVADRDCIYAVIRGAGVNNDGADKASFTAPSAAAQADVISFAQQCAGVDPRTITYVETHGTATPLGDPIEIEGLSRAFRRSTNETGFCAIGSVKSNVGHLVIAAGAAGLIKTALAAQRGVLPPSINFTSHNPKIDFAATPFFVNAALREWKPQHAPRRAGVSSFGVGGTNAHVIVEEPPASEPLTEAPGPWLLTLSARTEDALRASAERLAAHLRANQSASLSDVAYTLRTGRKHFAHRGFIVAHSHEDALVALSQPARFMQRRVHSRPPAVAFMFPGQGAQYAGMGRSLYARDAAFKEAFDACAAGLAPHVDFDLREVVFHGGADALTSTAITQPATFAIEYALAQMWMARGVKPAALIGHSVGEFVAATLTGVMQLNDALRLIAVRGRLMQAQPPGSMLSVRLAAEDLRARLATTGGALCIAGENSPQSTVLSGPTNEIEQFRVLLDLDGVANRVLVTSHAFHSSMMDSVVAPFEAEVRKCLLAAPNIPLASTLTGEWMRAEDATDPGYWSRHLREPVKFSPALRTLLTKSDLALLEAGPRNTLTTLARQHFTPKQPSPEILATLADDPEKELQAVATAIGALWAIGVDFDARPVASEGARRRVGLPGYPFERKRYWIEAASERPQIALPPPASPAPSFVSTAPEQQPSAEHAMPAPAAAPSRRDHFIQRLCSIIDEVVGVDLDGADPSALFVELGLDSLALTQIALQLQKAFDVKITFRQLMETYSTLGALADHLDAVVPNAASTAPAAASTPQPTAAANAIANAVAIGAPTGGTPMLQQVIEQQMQLMAQQLALLRSMSNDPAQTAAASSTLAVPQPATVAPAKIAAAPSAPNEEDANESSAKYDVKKAFGAIARIHTKSTTDLTDRQKARLDTFMRRYIARTQKSKDYTTRHRPHLADPRVVNGFRPQLKEIIYQLVIERSRGAHVWDIDGNEYVDALNGFGMSLFGWQPQFVLDAVRKQIDAGYEIGPQHPLAGEVAQLICEVTGFDRAGLCNTGSEAVMGALRIARTVTGRTKIALFTGAYHGIFDEVIVRAAKKLRAVPAAPGIMRNTSENVLVLDYGTPESLEILRANASELAAVLIEPVQSRRPDFQPREFLKELREITRQAGALYIFDEVVTGFRAHPRGAQAVLGIDADIATYGKVVGGGFPIGVIAGKREYMDALDGGAWQYGDDSIPTVGVTYFAGTFVRHPLALAAAKAVLEHVKEQGPAMQERLNERTAAMARELNAFCEDVGAPIKVKHFASVWKTFFDEDHPLQDLLFAMMRSRGVHILDNFPCFFTTAHTEADFALITQAFKESVRELQEADFLPRRASVSRVLLDASKPPVPGARLGRDADGKPAWFMPNPEQPGKFMKVSG